MPIQENPFEADIPPNERRHDAENERATLLERNSRPPLGKNIPPAPYALRSVVISPHVFMVVSLISFVLTLISIFVPFYRRQQYQPGGAGSTDAKFYLFKTVIKQEGGDTVTTHPSDYCWKVKRRVIALEAFTIASAAACFISLILGILHFIRRDVVRPTGGKTALHRWKIVVGGISFALLTIAISFNFNVYLWTFQGCSEVSYHSQLYEPNVGFGFIMTSWVLMGVGSVIGAHQLNLPLDARAVDQAVHCFTIFALIGMLFSTVACPIPHWFYKDGETRLATNVLLWREQVNNFDWDLLAPHNHTSLFVKDFGCSSVQAYFRAAEVFSVASIFFNALAGTCGFFLWHSLMGTRLPAVIFSCLGVVCTIVQVALELSIYYGSWCDDAYAYHKQKFVMSAGFALSATTIAVMIVATFFSIVAYVLTSKYFPGKQPKKTAGQILSEEYRR